MPHYRALFRLPGGKELEADKGYVPDEFFEAAQKVTPDDIVEVYEGGFILSNELHEKLNIPDAFISYAVVGITAPEGTDKQPAFIPEMIKRLKLANHARPLKDNLHYQVYFMEYIETHPDDD